MDKMGQHQGQWTGCPATVANTPFGFEKHRKDKGIRTCIPDRRQRKEPLTYDQHHYKRRNQIEFMFVRLKTGRRVATRYDRCPKVFFSAIALAATVVKWP